MPSSPRQAPRDQSPSGPVSQGWDRGSESSRHLAHQLILRIDRSNRSPPPPDSVIDRVHLDDTAHVVNCV